MEGHGDLALASLEQLDVSPETRAALREIKAELDAAYRGQISEMASAINRQAKALERIQTTLHILIRHIQPSLEETIPPVLRLAKPDEDADVASAVVVADPIAAGFTLSQRNIASALDISAPDVSVLVRAFKLHKDPEVAVTVRRGQGTEVIYYHPAVIEKFRSRALAASPEDVPTKARARLKRVVAKLS